MTKQQLREYVQRWFDCYDTEWGGDADGDSSKALSEVLACLADEPPAPQDSAWRLGRIRDIASGVGSYTESQRLDVIFDLCSAEPPVERDARLGRALYERMEHMDPSHESREWAQLTDSERELYITCAESVVVALNRTPPHE